MRTAAIVGPGRVGTALALALPGAGYEVVAVSGRGRGALDAFAARVPGVREVESPAIGDQAELVLLCVPDDALVEVVRSIARHGAVTEGSRWVHTSGGYGTDVLEPLRLAGGRVAACHPAQTFPDPEHGAQALPGTSWAVTASDRDLGWARVLVTDLRGSPVTVPGTARTLYHAGLTVGSNATSSVVTLARDLLLGSGVHDPAAFLGPLVTTSATNAVEHGAAALTGPVSRGDAGTVARHLAELRAVMPEAIEAYVALARLALSHARRRGLDDEGVRRVEGVLGLARPVPDAGEAAP